MKRIFDLILVVVSAPFWLPLLLVIYGLVKVRLGSPVVFEQVRPGIGGRPFMLVKFRTMTEARDADGSC